MNYLFKIRLVSGGFNVSTSLRTTCGSLSKDNHDHYDKQHLRCHHGHHTDHRRPQTPSLIRYFPQIASRRRCRTDWRTTSSTTSTGLPHPHHLQLGPLHLQPRRPLPLSDSFVPSGLATHCLISPVLLLPKQRTPSFLKIKTRTWIWIWMMVLNVIFI